MFIFIETIGWLSTLILIWSYLAEERLNLHIIGFAACVFKLIYTYYHEVWPLFANWLIILIIQAYKIKKIKSIRFDWLLNNSLRNAKIDKK